MPITFGQFLTLLLLLGLYGCSLGGGDSNALSPPFTSSVLAPPRSVGPSADWV